MKLFVWDFHGVLEKGNEKSVLEVSNLALEKCGFKKRISVEENNKLYGKKWFEYFEYLLPEENHETHLNLQAESREIQRSHPEIVSKYIETNEFVVETLEAIAVKHQQILISNCHQEALVNLIKLVKIDKFFNSKNTFSTNSHLDSNKITKIDILKEWVKKMNRYDKIISIGDSPQDMMIIEGIENVRYLYTHKGYPFKDCDADYKIHDLRAVLQEI